MTDPAVFRQELRKYLDRTGTPPSRMSIEALGDPRAVAEILRDDRQCGPRVIGALLFWMNQHPNGAGSAKAGRFVIRRPRESDDPPPPPVYRDPCWRCGARGDVECGCGGYRNTARVTR